MSQPRSSPADRDAPFRLLDDLETLEASHPRFPKLLNELFLDAAHSASLADAETKLFSRASPKTRLFFATLSDDPLDDRLQSRIEDAVALVAAMSGVAEKIVSTGDVNVADFRSFPVAGVGVVTSCYKFCSDLGLRPSPESLVPSAKSLAAAAHNLAAQLVCVYEGLVADAVDLSQFSQLVVDSLSGLREAVAVTRPVDVKIFSKLVKVVIKLALKQRALAVEIGEVGRMLDYFLGNVSTTISNFRLTVDAASAPQSDRAFVTETRLCQFMLRATANLVEELHAQLERVVVDAVVDFVVDLNLALTLGTLTSPSLPLSYSAEIDRLLRPHLHHLVESLVGDEPFQRRLLDASAMTSSNAAGHLPLYLDVVERLAESLEESVAENWIDPTIGDENLLDVVFVCAEKSRAEMLVPMKRPGPMYDGRPQRPTSLYEILCLRLNHLVGQLPPRFFLLVEPSVLRPVVEDRPLAGMLASDLLCFLARVAPKQVAWRQMVFLTEVFRMSKGNRTLERLLTRLYEFLPSSRRDELRLRFPIANYPSLWCLFSLRDSLVAAKELFLKLTADWNACGDDAVEFAATVRRCGRMMFRLRGADLSIFERMILKLINVVLGLLLDPRSSNDSTSLDPDYLVFLAHALDVTRDAAFASVDEMLDDDDALRVLRFCRQRLDRDPVDERFDQAVSCLLLALSTRRFGDRRREEALEAFMRAAAMLARRKNAFAALNSLRALERRSGVEDDAHFIAAFLVSDEELRRIALGFFAKEIGGGGGGGGGGGVAGAVNIYAVLKKQSESLFELERKKKASGERDEETVDKDRDGETKEVKGKTKKEEEEENGMDFALMEDDDDDEIFSQAVSEVFGEGKDERDEKSSSQHSEASIVLIGVEEGKKIDSKSVEREDPETMEGKEKEDKDLQRLVDNSLVELRVGVETLASHCRIWKGSSSRDGKLPSRTQEEIRRLRQELKKCI